MKLIVQLCLVVFPVYVAFTQPYTGGIQGKITDATTQEPLVGVIVRVVEIPTVGTTTDAEGTFRISGLPVGTYSLRVSAVGYEPQVITNVVVATGRQTPVRVKLLQTVIEQEQVTVEADYFSRGQALSPISTNVLDRSEVRRLPGALQDVQRAVQALPGVASSTDNINELIVRGGAPYENLTVLDYMEIPSINHYSNQFNSAGPITMVNADMIEDVQFSAGGFPVQFGDKTSSIMNLTVREGNRNVAFSSNTGFNMAGMGTLIEGGFANGRGSYILSARNSLLEVLDKMIGLSSLSLTAVPKYWDTQSKIVYDLSSTQKLKFNFLYGESKIAIEGDPKEEDESRRNRVDSSSVDRIYPHNRQIVLGLTLQSLWGKNGYSHATLYAVGSFLDVSVYADYMRRVRGNRGEVLESSLLNVSPVFTNRAEESFVGVKYEVNYQIHPQHELMMGAQVQTALRWKNDVWVRGDTSRFDLDRDGVFETGPILVPEWRFHNLVGFAQSSKYFLYASDKLIISQQLALTLGVRYDHFTYTGAWNLSPRASLTYQIAPPATRITVGVGRYAQTPPFPYLSDRRQIGYNGRLSNMYADDLVLGLEHILDDGLKLSLEGYYKRYRRIPISEDFIYSAIDTFWSDRYLTIGRRRSYGIEFLIEQKQVKDFYGTLSLSLSKTQDADSRIPPRVDWYPSDYDYPVIVTLVAGQVVRGIRDWLDNLPAFLRYPLYLLPFSNDVEFALKYRYQTGRPYTPKRYVT